MSFISDLFGTKNRPPFDAQAFWSWFKTKAKDFRSAVRDRDRIQQDFFDPLSKQLNRMRPGCFFLVGFDDQGRADLTFTPDGAVRHVAFIEDLVAAAPAIEGWCFTALKSAVGIDQMAIHLDGHDFDEANLSFYPRITVERPDEIDLVVVHRRFTESNAQQMTQGTLLFLDNYLGESRMIHGIDNITVCGPEQAVDELVPMSKLPSYLDWREKEFVEKYHGRRHNTDNDEYSSLDAELENGDHLIAILNSSLLAWDARASHPWMTMITITYDGRKGNGFPDNGSMARMEAFEEKISASLPDADGYLNLGRQTGDCRRTIYLACTDHRQPTRVIDRLILEEPGLKVEYEVFKDKYWQCMEHFARSLRGM